MVQRSPPVLGTAIKQLIDLDSFINRQADIPLAVSPRVSHLRSHSKEDTLIPDLRDSETVGSSNG